MNFNGFIFVIVFLANLYSCWSWGLEGHKIVAEIAERNLSERALFKVKRLLPDLSLSDISKWADEIRDLPEYQHTYTWHFVNLEPGLEYNTTPKNPAGDVVQAILLQQEILRSKRSLRVEKIRALRFLVHFVGDLHQPLHVGYGHDRGGNDIPVYWQGQQKNLHWVWDGDVITYRGQTWRELVSALSAPLSADEYRICSDLNPVTWLLDARSYLPEVYADLGDGNLSRTYFEKNEHIAHALLRRGGYRLAALLNDIFKD